MTSDIYEFKSYLGLGTLSILRTEDCTGPRFLFRSVLSTIIKLSLPSYSVMKEYIRRWNFSSEKGMFEYVRHLGESETNFLDDEKYEVSYICRFYPIGKS